MGAVLVVVVFAIAVPGDLFEGPDPADQVQTRVSGGFVYVEFPALIETNGRSWQPVRLSISKSVWLQVQTEFSKVDG